MKLTPESNEGRLGLYSLLKHQDGAESSRSTLIGLRPQKRGVIVARVQSWHTVNFVPNVVFGESMAPDIRRRKAGTISTTSAYFLTCNRHLCDTCSYTPQQAPSAESRFRRLEIRLLAGHFASEVHCMECLADHVIHPSVRVIVPPYNSFSVTLFIYMGKPFVSGRRPSGGSRGLQGCLRSRRCSN